MRIKRWEFSPLDTALAAELAEQCEIQPFLSLLLTTRGMTAPEDVYAYISGQEEEADPFAWRWWPGRKFWYTEITMWMVSPPPLCYILICRTPEPMWSGRFRNGKRVTVSIVTASGVPPSRVSGSLLR